MREELLGITIGRGCRDNFCIAAETRRARGFHPPKQCRFPGPRGSDRHLFTVWRRGNDDYRHPLMSLLEELLRSPDFQHCDIECLSLEVTPACQTHVIWSPSTFRASRR
jgi:hypothetical protein